MNKKKINVRFREEERPDIDVLFSASVMDGEVRSLMDRIVDPLAGTLTVTDADGASVALPESQIISISSSNKRLKILAEGGLYDMKSSLQDIESMLHPGAFLRISRYEIINLDKVRKFDFTISGTLRIEMDNGRETWASRRFIPVIKSRLRGKEKTL